MKPLEGKVAIVTGAGRLRGIGRAAAVALAESGADVVITGTGRDPSTFPPDEKARGWRDIESTAAQVLERGSRALAVLADVTSDADVRATVSATLTEFGRIDIVVNNAALPRGADRVEIGELAEDVWRRVLDVKLTGSFLMCRAAVPVIIGQKEGGSIVNISSIAGKRGTPRTAAYCAANAGIQGLTRALAAELAPHNIRVNAVCPGITDTSRMDVLGRGEDWNARLQSIPLRRAASDEEIGRFVAWLCAPDASYITGQSINIDGGVVTW